MVLHLVGVAQTQTSAVLVNLLVEVVRSRVAPVNDDSISVGVICALITPVIDDDYSAVSVGVISGVVVSVVVNDDDHICIICFINLVILIIVGFFFDLTPFERGVVKLPTRPATNLAIVPEAEVRVVLLLVEVCCKLYDLTVEPIILLLVELVAEVGRDVPTTAGKIILVA